MKKDISAAILAGGLNSRMNYKDKSQLVYKGETFIERIMKQLTEFNEVIIITNQKENDFSETNARIFPDLIEKIGPLGGIYTALSHSESEHVFVTSCDMPLIRQKFINEICSDLQYDIVMPVYENKYEMLFALYSRNCLKQIELLVQENRYKITGLLEDKSLKIKKIPIGMDFYSTLHNINTKKDYRNLIII